TWREAPSLTGAGYHPPLAISPDGKLLAVGGGTYRDGCPKVYDLPGRQKRIAFEGHTDTVFAVKFTADGKHLTSAGTDRTVRIWDVATGQQKTSIAHPGPVYGLALTPDGGAVAAVCTDAIRVSEVAAPAPSSVLPHVGSVNALAFSPDEKVIASCG